MIVSSVLVEEGITRRRTNAWKLEKRSIRLEARDAPNPYKGGRLSIAVKVTVNVGLV